MSIESLPSANVLAEFHDAELQKIVMDRTQKTLTLGFDLDTGLRREISFFGVLEYKLSDIYSQNVVSRILLSSIDGMDESCLDQVLALVYDRRSVGQPDFPEAVRSDILNQKLLLFYLEPSVGAEAAVVAESILISEASAADTKSDIV